jgi:AcrR family transcriptional regulator
MDERYELDRRQRKRQVLHERLLDTAGQLFRERGIAQTTVDDIADAADVCRQTVFNHFPYKECLALELGEEAIRRIGHRAHALLEAGVPALEVLQQAAEWVLDAAMAEGDVAVAVAQELLHPDPERAERAARQVPIRDILEAILVQAWEEGSVRDDLPIDVMASRISAVLTSIVPQVTARDPQHLRRDLSICFDIVFNGIMKRSA